MFGYYTIFLGYDVLPSLLNTTSRFSIVTGVLDNQIASSWTGLFWKIGFQEWKSMEILARLQTANKPNCVR